MREFRGDGGREAKADPEFRVDWKGENTTTRAERKDGGREHRGGDGREAGGGGRRESRSVAGGGDTGGRERKSDDNNNNARVSSAQETGELRESWGSRTFLKSSSAHVEEEGEIGEFTDDGGGAGAGGGGEPARFEEVKRKRDDSTRGGVVNNSNNNSERDERAPRDKSDRRGDLQVHISFVSSSQRDKERGEDKAEQQRDKETNNKELTKQQQNQQQKEKPPKEKDDSAKDKAAAAAAALKESEVDSRGRDKDSDGYRRKEASAAVDQEEKDQNPTSERAEKRGGPPIGDFEESAVGTSSAVRNAADDAKLVVVGEATEAVKERERSEGGKEHDKGKMELVEEEKGKRKLRDYDRAGVGGGDEGNNADADDYEREVVSSYGAQRKRFLRPRGHYQGSSHAREVRPRFRVKDPENYHARAENSSLVYRVGEGLQEELRRIRKEFEDRNGKLSAEQQQSASSAPTIEVRIPAELATTSNRQVQGSQLWGTDVYTDDSDLVAVLMHTGFYAPTSSPPPASISELRATVRVLSPQESYTSTLRNALRSRAWGAASGCAFSVDNCCLVKKDGTKVPLEPRLTFTPSFAPTLAPAVTERTVTTRAVSMNAYRSQRYVQEVTIQYNLCNEPWLKYSMNIVADKGLKKFQYTSARVKKGDVLYVETHFKRYELSYEDNSKPAATSHLETKTSLDKGKEKADSGDKGGEKSAEKGALTQGGTSKEVVEKTGSNHHNGPVAGDNYRWAVCKWPLPLQSMRAKGVPLSLDYVKVLESGLGWEEVQWSPAGVCVRGKEYPLARAHFVTLQE